MIQKNNPDVLRCCYFRASSYVSSGLATHDLKFLLPTFRTFRKRCISSSYLRNLCAWETGSDSQNWLMWDMRLILLTFFGCRRGLHKRRTRGFTSRPVLKDCASVLVVHGHRIGVSLLCYSTASATHGHWRTVLRHDAHGFSLAVVLKLITRRRR